MKAYILTEIPEDLHRRIKVLAARKGTTMKQIFLTALREYLETRKSKTVDNGRQKGKRT